MIGEMTGTVMSWAIDTALYTGVLIAAVLFLRKPVAKAFGPRTAYTLWLLPLARFVLPPIVLPAWMKPAGAVEAVEAVPLSVDPVAAALPVTAGAPVSEPLVSVAMLADVAIAVWLVGAVLFLGWRMACYRAMTRHLLDDARTMGDVGPIRLVETPAVAAPVAFGVFERVIALPPGFMASEDTTARDLAIAHEIAHHRGYDLLANLVAQPVLALHWCNPVAWLGWRAMRRDQEAACDARVMSGRSSADRALYGEVIAACSRDQNLAPRFILAAPMAGFREIGPALGEKAIVHRLRSLGMNTTTRRHRTGLLLVGAAGLIALSATASISYAEADAPEPSAVARTDVPASTADVAAVAPVTAAAEPEAKTRIHMIVKDDKGGDFEWHSDDGQFSPEARARMEADLKRAEADIARARAEHGRAMAEIDKAQKLKVIALADKPEVEEEVSADGKVRTIRIYKHGADGKRAMVQEMFVDEGKIGRDAIEGAIRGLEKTRSALSASKDLSAEIRAEVLDDLDRELAELRAELSGK